MTHNNTNREIKFRAWDKDYECMYDWSELSIEEDQVFISDGDLYKDFDHVILMQYTGLKDKNGTEIYEGDIVKIPYVDPMGELHVNTSSGNSSVGFEKGQFVVYRTEPQALIDWCEKKQGDYISNYGNLTIVSDTTTLEVIGNIYEHPHLLEATS